MSYYLLLLLGITLVLLVACQPAATIAPAAPVTADTPSPTEPPATPSAAPTVTRVDPTPTDSPLPPSPTQELATPEATPTDTPIPPTNTPSPPPATETAANADVERVRAVQSPDGTWTFYVTVSHPDTGWEDYADGWDVLTPDGTVFKPDPSSPFTRLLLHPHETEQPFTRSQSGIAIPQDVTQVLVRAHDLVDGFGGREVIVDLTVSRGPDFEVERSQ